MTMRLTVIGCAGSFPGPDSPASCYLVEADGFRMLLDLGNGALGGLQRQAGLFALGSYTGAILAARLGFDIIGACLGAGVVSGLFGVLLA